MSKNIKSRSARLGRAGSLAEVTNVSTRGFWLLVDGDEKFVAFKKFPWFRHATIAEIATVRASGANHLYWPDLDIDLAVDSIDHPDRYPLVSKPGALTRERNSAYRRAPRRRPR